jgi:hypothetical protein
MALKAKDLLFYNKEGNPMNLNYDQENDRWNGKIFFDKNSTDTYKTQGIYLFEKIDGSTHNINGTLNKFQLFNTNDFNVLPKFEATRYEITNIERSNVSPAFNTKWIYADNIEQTFYVGMYCHFTGVDGFHGNDFDEQLVNLQTFKVIAVEKGKILVLTATDNSVIMPTYTQTPTPTQFIVPIDIIEVPQLNEPAWNETNINNKLYAGKKISFVVDSDNAGVYTINNICNTHNRYSYRVDQSLILPTLNDIIEINIDFNTTNITVINDTVSFNYLGNPNDILLPNIPSFLKVGDTLQGIAKSVPLITNNAVQLTITNIDRATNIITVAQNTVTQTVDCILQLATNTFNMQQIVVLDNNNTPSVPLTFWAIKNKYENTLNNLGVFIDFDYNNGDLILNNLYNGQYTTITVNNISGQTITPITTTQTIYTVEKLYVDNLVLSEQIKRDSTLYYREILFNSIDSYGLNLFINGILYAVDFDTNVNNTIMDFISQHQAALNLLGISINQIGLNILTITCDFPNVPMFVESRLGDFTDYIIKYKTYTFNNIKTQLLINIDGADYIVPFNTDDITTLTDWVTQYKSILRNNNIVVSNTGNVLHIDLIEFERSLNITYNIGYIPKSGELSVVINELSSNSTGTLIAGNEIVTTPGTYQLLSMYSTGQKVSIDNAIKKTQNKSYNIIGLTDDTISLSYQSAFWDQSPAFDISIISDYFIRFPRHGYNSDNVRAKLKYSWKDTITNDFFYYDFSGNQLSPINGIPNYNGIKPLCGLNGEIKLSLIKRPNENIKFVNDPTKQQTVFDVIKYDLPTIDDNTLNGDDPSPLQLFIGYNAPVEGWNKARTYLELVEDLIWELTPTSTNNNNITFKDNYLEISNLINPISFTSLGFEPGQIIEVSSFDNTGDNLQLAVAENSGKRYIIKTVSHNKITFTTNVTNETATKMVPSPVVPYTDINGNTILVTRLLNIKLTVMPKVIAYFDIYGESEEEDTRHKINLNNRNLNILKMKDFYIFKDVDINESGIDWIYMNRKRKELIEIYPQIFNNIGTYKSVIHSINFFGYNDLTFTEYFQNIDPENPKFGELLNMETLNMFDKTVDGFSYSNLAYKKLKNAGFRKTNLFSLNYKITDKEGNFLNAYSLDEVRIKLLGLQKWLTDNIIPIGTNILSINGKYIMPQSYTIQHESYMSKRYRVEEYGEPVDFSVNGYISPITQNGTTYNISVEFFSPGNIDFYEYNIKTFNLPTWDENTQYLVNDQVFYNNATWTAKTTIKYVVPGTTTDWVKEDITNYPLVQEFKDYKWQADTTSFTIDENIDPHFIIEVFWHSGYGLTHTTKKTFSVKNNL